MTLKPNFPAVQYVCTAQAFTKSPSHLPLCFTSSTRDEQ